MAGKLMSSKPQGADTCDRCPKQKFFKKRTEFYAEENVKVNMAL